MQSTNLRTEANTEYYPAERASRGPVRSSKTSEQQAQNSATLTTEQIEQKFYYIQQNEIKSVKQFMYYLNQIVLDKKSAQRQKKRQEIANKSQLVNQYLQMSSGTSLHEPPNLAGVAKTE